MEKKFVIILSDDMARYIAPQFFSSEEVARLKLEGVRRTLKNPSDVKLMKLVEVV